METQTERDDSNLTRPQDSRPLESTSRSEDDSVPTNNNSMIMDDDEGEALSVEKVSRMMREQDADLLESMHYAASQVSQYSPGGTPVLRPKDRSLPMEDVPLIKMPLSSTGVLLLRDDASGKAQQASSGVRTASFREPSRNVEARNSLDRSGQGATGPRTSIQNLPSPHRVNSATYGNSILPTIQDDSFREDMDSDRIQEDQSAITISESRYRRLLSGEVRSFNLPNNAASTTNEEEETTASPISVSQEAAAAALKQQQQKDSGLAEERRVREAIQFAEAVGEHISINRDELCIIEDSSEEGDLDDDDDEACESKEIVVDDRSVQDAMSASQAKSETLVIPMTPNREYHGALEDTMAPLPTIVDIPLRPALVRRKSKRPLWPFGPAGSDYDRFLDNLSDGANQSDFVYKGICANPPEITKHGIQRGNYAQLHRKAWLEVSDKYHRYGKNLRLYYRYWERLGFPTNQFFDWLDSKGEAAGQPLPNLDECPRTVLDSDTVLYITNPEVTEGYALEVVASDDGRVASDDGRGRIIDVDGSPVLTGQDGWIIVLRDGVMYGAQKITSITGHSKQRFHHSSFFGGKAVSAAGIVLTDDEGYLTRLYPHSGHYRPGEAHMQRMLFFLHRKGVDLRTFEMDTQQFRHVSREKDTLGKAKDGEKNKEMNREGKDGEKKMKKVDSLHLEKAVNVACFLAHKASFIGSGIFDMIHKIRKADAICVSEALDCVDGGASRRRSRIS